MMKGCYGAKGGFGAKGGYGPQGGMKGGMAGGAGPYGMKGGAKGAAGGMKGSIGLTRPGQASAAAGYRPGAGPAGYGRLNLGGPIKPAGGMTPTFGKGAPAAFGKGAPAMAARGSLARAPAMAARAPQRAPQRAAPVVPVIQNPEFYWASVDPASQLPADGYTTDGPMVVHDKACSIFSSAKHIMQEIFASDVATHVKIVHDLDCTQFPEIMEAATAQGCTEEMSFALAMYPAQAKWAVGIGSGTQGRERAVYIATALAVSMSRPKLRSKLSKTYPEFGTLMEALLAQTGEPEEEDEALPDAILPAEEAAQVVAAGDGSEIRLVTIPDTASIVTDGYATEGFALSHDKQAGVFSESAQILGELLGDDLSEKVQFTHDVDWSVFPEIAAGLGVDPTPQNCLCVATCPEHAKWGAGLAGNWKPREHAARVALAMAIAQGTDDMETLKKKYPAFAGYVGDM